MSPNPFEQEKTKIVSIKGAPNPESEMQNDNRPYSQVCFFKSLGESMSWGQFDAWAPRASTSHDGDTN